jgi:hypothetical protein
MKKIYLLLLLSAYSAGAGAQTLINEQYASSVIAFSSQYGGGPGYNAIQALGASDVYPNCGDNQYAWTSASPDGQREYLVLGFTIPQPVNTIRIYQNVAPGAVDTVYLRNASTSAWNQVYVATAAGIGPCVQLLEIKITTTAYNVDAIRIAINSPVVGYYNEIDAVSLPTLMKCLMHGSRPAIPLLHSVASMVLLRVLIALFRSWALKPFTRVVEIMGMPGVLQHRIILPVNLLL